MADLAENESISGCPKTELESSYSVVAEPFSCTDEVGPCVIESFAGSEVSEAGFLDGHHLIVDSVLDSGGHLVTSNGQLFKLFKDAGELVSAAGTVNGPQTIILRSQPFSQTASSSSEKLLAELAGEAIGEEEEQILDDEDMSLGGKGERSSGHSADVSQAWFTTKDDKLAYQSKGHQWKQGQWTQQEVEALRSNIVQYCEERSISNPAEVIFDMTKDERKNFYRTIARGLQRPLFSVYRRVIRMYDRKNYRGKYSADELSRLKELRKKHGSDWATIGGIMGRSASSVKDRCRLMKDTCNTGKWYPEEEKRLAEAVYRLSGASPGESVTSGLSWAQVADHVHSRSEKQCRTKWLNYLNWKEKGGAEWTRDDDVLLLERLMEVNVEEESDINWIGIASDWPSARSPQWLHGKWWSMKRHVHNYSQMAFPVLLETVKSMHIQNKTRSPSVSSFSSSSSLPATLEPGNSIRLEHLDLHNIQMMPGMTLTIPVTVAIDGSLSAEIREDEDEERSRTEVSGSNYQAYQLMEDVVYDHSDQEAYIKIETDAVPSSTVFTMSGVLPEGFVVRTVDGQVNKNVLVQMNPGMQQIFIARDLHDDSNDSSSSAHVASSHHQAAFHQLENTVGSGHDLEKVSTHRIFKEELEQEEVGSMASVINTDDMVVDEHIDCNIMSRHSLNEVIIDSEIHEPTDEGSSLTLVGLTEPHFVRSESNDGRIINPMSSFSDPMLITDSSDLLGSMSDGDGEKCQETIDDIDVSSN